MSPDTDRIATSDPDILGGTPVFSGTRVPVATLFENLADGLTLEEILNSYPSISRDVASRALAQAGNCLGTSALLESVVADRARLEAALVMIAKAIDSSRCIPDGPIRGDIFLADDPSMTVNAFIESLLSRKRVSLKVL